MPAARYWRIVAIDVVGRTDLEVSEIALFEAGVRVDDDASISSDFAPQSGALADLSDADFGTAVLWSASDVSAPGFQIVWDFGVGISKDITRVEFASPTLAGSFSRVTFQYSTDGEVWMGALRLGPAWTSSSSLAVGLEIDDFYDRIALLLRPIGFDASTAIYDESVYGRALTLSGDVQIDTSLGGFGGTSIQFDGTGDYITVPFDASIDFSTANFTIRGWFRPAAVTGSQVLMSQRVMPSASSSGFLFYTPSGTPTLLRFLAAVGGTSFNINLNATTPIAAGVRTHFEVTRSGNTFRLFINGELQASDDRAGALTALASIPLRIGCDSDLSAPVNGRIDDFEVAINVARHVANFTPPSTQAYVPVSFERDVLLSSSSVKIVEAEPLVFDSHMPQEIRGYYDLEDGGSFRIAGTVKEVALPTNTPLSRRVRLAYQDSGRVIRETFSDAAGNYSFEFIRGDRPFIALALDHAGIYRPVAADNLVAEPM